MAKIIGVQFKEFGKIYYFGPRNEKFMKGDGVIVETAKGQEYAKVAILEKEVPDEEIVQPLRDIVRKATAKDEEMRRKFLGKRQEAMRIASEHVASFGLDMKIVDCEYAFDGSKVVFSFTSEGRVDFRNLVKDLASTFRARIELRQIGIRDEAKLLGGIAPCGRPCCCSSFLQDFKKVSIKMAKTQGLSLNPGKISGLCGRLMCCLEYENEYYSEVYKKMPKVGGEVNTPDGKGTVVSNDMLRLVVKVKRQNADGSEIYREYSLGDVEQIKRSPDQQASSQKGEKQGEKPGKEDRLHRDRDRRDRRDRKKGAEGGGKGTGPQPAQNSGEDEEIPEELKEILD